MSTTPASIRRAAPELGQHTEEVLLEYGFSREEISELKDHPFMIGCQFHPEFLSAPLKAHPLFKEFIKTVINISK